MLGSWSGELGGGGSWDDNLGRKVVDKGPKRRSKFIPL